MRLSRDQKRKKKLADRRKKGLARPRSDGQHRLVIDTEKLTPTVQKVRKALEEEGLRIFCRVVNHRLDYSLQGPPDYEVASEWLSVALIEGVGALKRLPHPSISEKIARSDGRDVTYDQLIWYDFAQGHLYSTIEDEALLKQIVAFVAQDLHRMAVKTMAAAKGVN